MTILLTNVNTRGKCCLVLQVPINSENQYYWKLSHCLRHLPIQRLAWKYWKNTKREKHKQNCLLKSSRKNLRAFGVIYRLRFRGLLFLTSDRVQRDTGLVVGNLMRLRNITSAVMCFIDTDALTVSSPNIFRLDGLLLFCITMGLPFARCELRYHSLSPTF